MTRVFRMVNFLSLVFLFLFLISFSSAFDFPHTIVNIDFTGNLTNLSEMADVNIPSPTNTQVLTWDTGTSKWIASDSSAGNSSWNQSHANTLYYDLGNSFGYYNSTSPPPGGNSSWNQSHADTLYADISVTGDNATWNEALADTLYADISVTGDNATWNEALADTLYYDISDNVLGYYNSSDFSIADYYLNSNPFGFYNSSNPQPGANSSWNQTHANTLYADISVTGDNATWNEALADTLYYDLGNSLGYFNSSDFSIANYYLNSNPFSFYNTSDFSIADYYLNSNPFGFYNSTNPQPGANSSWNQTHANTLYADISVTGDNATWNEALADTLYYDISNNVLGFYNSSDFSITDYYLNSNPFSFYNTSDFSIADYYLNSNPFGFYNSTSPQPGANSSWNETHADTLYADISVTGDNSSWNETHANTLYADILVTGDNSSWNETHADTLYADISVTGDNATWNEALADTLYYDLGNSLGYYNSSDFSIADYYLNSNPFGFYNSTSPQPGANSSWNETHADTLYLPHTIDTNASNCGDGEYLDGDGTCIDFNNTVQELITAVEYNATNINTLTGTLDSGDLDSILSREDGDVYNVSEVTGTPGFDIVINFTGIDNFNAIAMREWYEGSSAHIVNVQLRLCGDGTYQTKGTVVDQEDFGVSVINVFNTNNHICGAENNVSLKILHSSSGNANHDFFLDSAHLVKGAPSTSPTESDPFSIHKDGTVQLTANWDQGAFNLTNTNSWFLGKINWTTIQNLFSGSTTDDLSQGSTNLYDNQTWNETHADTLYAPAGSGNSSWNETHANTLYYDLGNSLGYYNSSDFSIADYYLNSNPFGFYNSTNPQPGANSSWNETHADTLYADISVTGDNATWNETHANTLYADISVTGDNATWNEALADTLYSPIGSGNSSWNETHANTLYYDISDNVLGYYNSSDFSIADYYLNSNPFSFYNSTNPQPGANSSWNQSHANTLYADISVTGDNATWNEALADTLYYDISDNVLGFYNSTNPQPGANSSWNETHADTLYSPIGSGNSSWNETHADTLYADISVTGDNSSWNETHANTLYYDLGNSLGYYNSSDFSIADYYLNTNPFSFYNSTNPQPGANSSWNETHADTLYADISVTGDNATWNEALADTLYYDISDNVLGFYNSTNPQPGANSSWNETHADTLYSPIGSGNSSWNEALADTLYYDISDNVLGYYNSSDFSIADYYLNSNPFGFYNSTSPQPGANSSWNETHADTLYADISVTGDNATWNETHANTLYSPIGSGNSSWNEALADTLYYDISDNVLGFYNSTNPQPGANSSWNETHANTLYYDLGNSLGYYNSSDFSIADYYLNSNPFNFYNSTNPQPGANSSWNETHADTLYADISVTGDNSSWNETHADTLYSPIGSGNSSWNETHADTLYADISVIGDNSSWNETHADTLYSPIGSGNSSWNETHANTLYYDISDNVLGYYNSTDFSITDYYLNSNPFSFYNSTNPQPGANSSWNQTHADTLYAELGSVSGGWINDSINTNTTLNVNIDGNLSVGEGPITFDLYHNGTTVQFDTMGDNANFVDNITADFYFGDGSQLINLPTGNSSWNETHANTLYYDLGNSLGYYNSSDFSIADYYLNSNPFSFYNSTNPQPGANSSWNQTHADTLYADISVTGDNSSWNETHADTLYSPIGSGNSSWNETHANTLYYDISDNVLGFYNSTDFSIADYYLNSNPFSFYNSTNPQPGANSSWNETHANTLYYDLGNSLGYYNSSDFSIADYYLNSNPFSFYNSTSPPPASAITAGTFGTGSYTIDTNLTVEKLVFETDASHYMEDNSTCIKIYGDTSILEIC